MSAFPNFFPTVGKASAATDLANHLGDKVEVGKLTYRLVQAGAAIAAAEKKVVCTKLSSGVPTWVVDVGGASGASVSTPTGVIPVGQTGSTGTTGIVSGDYFLVQISGAAKCLAAATLAALDSVGCASTAGKIDTTATVSEMIGTATEAGAAADAEVDVLLRYLPQ
jgi:hypothetical protein